VQSLGNSEAWPLGKRLADWALHLILPVLISTYGSFAFLSRQVRTALLEVLGQDYIRTARAKGLPERTVVWRHAFRNALLPLITLFGAVFPAMVGGSVIVESIFEVPGMGRTTYQAIFAKDFPLVIAVFTLTAVLTLVGQLVSDILYALADPRISYQKKNG
jgi:peptide/nickel transport system permease protein